MSTADQIAHSSAVNTEALSGSENCKFLLVDIAANPTPICDFDPSV